MASNNPSSQQSNAVEVNQWPSHLVPIMAVHAKQGFLVDASKEKASPAELVSPHTFQRMACPPMFVLDTQQLSQHSVLMLYPAPLPRASGASGNNTMKPSAPPTSRQHNNNNTTNTNNNNGALDGVVGGNSTAMNNNSFGAASATLNVSEASGQWQGAGMSASSFPTPTPEPHGGTETVPPVMPDLPAAVLIKRSSDNSGGAAVNANSTPAQGRLGGQGNTAAASTPQVHQASLASITFRLATDPIAAVTLIGASLKVHDQSQPPRNPSSAAVGKSTNLSPIAELRIPNHPAVYLLYLPPPQLLAPSVNGTARGVYTQDELSAFATCTETLQHYITVANRIVNAKPIQPLLLRMRMDFANTVGAIPAAGGGGGGGGGRGYGGDFTPEALARELQNIRSSFIANAAKGNGTAHSPSGGNSMGSDVMDKMRRAERAVRRKFAAERRRINRLNCQGLNSLTVSLSTHTRNSRRRPQQRSASSPAGVGGRGSLIPMSPVGRRRSSFANGSAPNGGRQRNGSLQTGTGKKMRRPSAFDTTSPLMDMFGEAYFNNINGEGGGAFDNDDDLSMDEIQSSSEDDDIVTAGDEQQASARGGGGGGGGDRRSSVTSPSNNATTGGNRSSSFSSSSPFTVSQRRAKRLAAKRAVRDRERMLLAQGEVADLNRGTIAASTTFEAGQKKTSCSVALGFTVGSATQVNFNIEMEHGGLGRLITFRKFRPLLASPDSYLPSAASNAMNRRNSLSPTSASPIPTASYRNGGSVRTSSGGRAPSTSMGGDAKLRINSTSVKADASLSLPTSPNNTTTFVTDKEEQKRLDDEARFVYEDIAKEEWWARLAPYNAITMAELLARHKTRHTAAVLEMVAATNAPMCLQMAECYRFGPRHRLPDLPTIKGRVEVWVEPLPAAFELFHFSAVGLVRRAGQVGVVTYADPILRLQIKPHPMAALATQPKGIGSNQVTMGADGTTNTLQTTNTTSKSRAAGASDAAEGGSALSPALKDSLVPNTMNTSLYLSEGYRNAHAAAFLPIPIAHSPQAMLDSREPFIDMSAVATTLIEKLTSIAPSNVGNSGIVGVGGLSGGGDGSSGVGGGAGGGGGPSAGNKLSSPSSTSLTLRGMLGGAVPSLSTNAATAAAAAASPSHQVTANADALVGSGGFSRHVMCSSVLPGDILPPIPVVRIGVNSSSSASSPSSSGGASLRNPALSVASPHKMNGGVLSLFGGGAARRPVPPSASNAARRAQSVPAGGGDRGGGHGANSSHHGAIGRLMPRSSLLAQTILLSSDVGYGAASPNTRSQSAPPLQSRVVESSATSSLDTAVVPTSTTSDFLPPTAAIPLLTCSAPMRESSITAHVIDGMRGCSVAYAAAVVEASGGTNLSAVTAMAAASNMSASNFSSSASPIAGGGGSNGAMGQVVKSTASQPLSHHLGSTSGGKSSTKQLLNSSGTLGSSTVLGGNAPPSARPMPTPTSFREDGTIVPILLGSLEVKASDIATRSRLAMERGVLGVLIQQQPPPQQEGGGDDDVPVINFFGGEETDANEANTQPSSASPKPSVPTVAAGVIASPLKRYYGLDGQLLSDYDQYICSKEGYPEVGADCYADYPPPHLRRLLAPKALLTSYIADGRVLSSRLGAVGSACEASSTAGNATPSSSPLPATAVGVITNEADMGDVETRRKAAMAAAAATQKQGAIPVGVNGAASVLTSSISMSGSNSPRRGGGSAGKSMSPTSPMRSPVGRGGGGRSLSQFTRRRGSPTRGGGANSANAVDGPFGALLANGGAATASSPTSGAARNASSSNADASTTANTTLPCQNTVVPSSYRVAPKLTIVHLQHHRIIRGIPTPCSQHNYSLLDFMRSPKNGIEFHSITAIDFGTRMFVNRKVRRYLDLSCYPSIKNTSSSRELEDLVDPMPFVEYLVQFCKVTKRGTLLHESDANSAAGAAKTPSEEGNDSKPAKSGEASVFPNGWSAMHGILAVVQHMLEPIAFRNAKSHNSKEMTSSNRSTSDTDNMSPFGAARVLHRWREGKRVGKAPCPPLPPGDVIAFYNETRLDQQCEDEGDEMADRFDDVAMNNNQNAVAGLNRDYFDNSYGRTGGGGGGDGDVVRRLYVTRNEGNTRPVIASLSVEKDLNSIILPPNADLLAGTYDATSARGVLMYQALSGKYTSSSSTMSLPAGGRFVSAEVPDTNLIDQHELPKTLEQFTQQWLTAAKGSLEAKALTDITAAKQTMLSAGGTRMWLRKGSPKAMAIEAVMQEKEKALLTSKEEILEAYAFRPRDVLTLEALSGEGQPSGVKPSNLARSDAAEQAFGRRTSGGLGNRKRRFSNTGDGGDGNEDDGSSESQRVPVDVVYDEDYTFPYRYRLAIPAAKTRIIREEEAAYLATIGDPLGSGNKRTAADEVDLLNTSSRTNEYPNSRPPSSSVGRGGMLMSAGRTGTSPTTTFLDAGGVNTSITSDNSAAARFAPAHIYNIFNLPMGITSPLQVRLTETAEDLVTTFKSMHKDRETQKAHFNRRQFRRAMLQQPPSPLVDVLKSIVERCHAKQLAREALFEKERLASAAIDEENDEEEWSDDEFGLGDDARAMHRNQMASSVAVVPLSSSASPTPASLALNASTSPNHTALSHGTAHRQDIFVERPPTIRDSYFDRVDRSELIMNPREQRRAFQHEARAGRSGATDGGRKRSFLQQNAKCPTIHHIANVVVAHPLQRLARRMPRSGYDTLAMDDEFAEAAFDETDLTDEGGSCDLDSIMQYLASVAHLPIHFMFIFVNCEAPVELTRLPNVFTSDFYTLAQDMMRKIPQHDRLAHFFETVVLKPNPTPSSTNPPLAATAQTGSNVANGQSSPTTVATEAANNKVPITSPTSATSDQQAANTNSSKSHRVTFAPHEPDAGNTPVSPLSTAVIHDHFMANRASKPSPPTEEELQRQEHQRNTLLTVHASMRSLHKLYDTVPTAAVNYCRAHCTDEQLPIDSLDPSFDPNELLEATEMAFDELLEAMRQKEMDAQMAAVAEAVAETARKAYANNEGHDPRDPFAGSNHSRNPLAPSHGDGSTGFAESGEGASSSAEGGEAGGLDGVDGSRRASEGSRRSISPRRTLVGGVSFDSSAEHPLSKPAFDESSLPFEERQNIPAYTSGASCFAQIDTWQYANGDNTINRLEYLKARENFQDVFSPDSAHYYAHRSGQRRASLGGQYGANAAYAGDGGYNIVSHNANGTAAINPSRMPPEVFYNVAPPSPVAVLPPTLRPSNTQGSGPEQYRRLMVLQSLSPTAVEHRARSPQHLQPLPAAPPSGKRRAANGARSSVSNQLSVNPSASGAATGALVTSGHVQGQALMSRHLSDDEDEEEAIIWNSEGAVNGRSSPSRSFDKERGQSTSPHHSNLSVSPVRGAEGDDGTSQHRRRVGVEKAALTVLDVFMEPSELEKHQMHATQITQILTGGGKEGGKDGATTSASAGRSLRGSGLNNSATSPTSGRMRYVRDIANANAKSTRSLVRPSSPSSSAVTAAASPLVGRHASARRGGSSPRTARDLSPTAQTALQHHMRQLMLIEENVLRRKLQHLQQRDDVWVALDDAEEEGSASRAARAEGGAQGAANHENCRTVVTVKIDPKFRELTIDDDEDTIDGGGQSTAGNASGIPPTNAASGKKTNANSSTANPSPSSGGVANGNSSASLDAPTAEKKPAMHVIGGKHSHTDRFTAYRVQVDGAPLQSELFATNKEYQQVAAAKTANRFLQLSRTGTASSSRRAGGGNALLTPTRPGTANNASASGSGVASPYGGGGSANGPSPRKSSLMGPNAGGAKREMAGNALLGGSATPRPRSISAGRRTSPRSSSARNTRKAGGRKKHTVDEMLYTSDGSVSLQSLPPAKARQLKVMLRGENAVYGGPRVDPKLVRQQEEQWEHMLAVRTQVRHQQELQQHAELVRRAVGSGDAMSPSHEDGSLPSISKR